MLTKRVASVGVLLLLAATARDLPAKEAGIFRIDTRDEALLGKVESVTIDQAGVLSLALESRRLVGLDEPFALAVASAVDGSWIVGTGNGGKVFRVRSEGSAELLGHAAETQIFAVLATQKGEIFAASSPEGQVYRVGKTGLEPFFDPDGTYIWALAEDRDGRLLVATGLPAKLFRVDQVGRAELLFESIEPHFRSLAIAPDGSVILGTAGQGHILRLRQVGNKVEATTVFDAEQPEVGALAFDEAGLLLAALVASEASSVELAAPVAAGATTETEPQLVGTRSKDAALARSALVSLDLSNFQVERLVDLADETIHALAILGDQVLIGTGQEGKLYRYQDHVLSTEADLEERQIVGLAKARDGRSLGMVTTDAVTIYQLQREPAEQGLFTSAVLDTIQSARFGLLRAEGRLAGSSFEARTGMSATPDPTWVEWTPLQALDNDPGAFDLAPLGAARYVQWRVKLRAEKSILPRIQAVEVSFRQENRAPKIEKLEVMAPGEILVSSSFNPTATVFEAWSPNRDGIFTAIKPEEDKSEGRLKTLFKKGYRSLRFSVTDANEDSLRYKLEVRPEADPEAWLLMVDELDTDFFSFDASVLPDGRYRFRLTASDALSRPADEAKASTRISEAVTIDHSAPRLVRQGEREGLIEVVLEDLASPIRSAAFSSDGLAWQALEAQDGIFDGRRETVKVKKPEGARLMMLRVSDAAFNVVTFALAAREPNQNEP
jgi:hypothetical protein